MGDLRLAALLAAAAVSVLAAGCYTQPKRTQSADLHRVEQLLPGHYDDSASGGTVSLTVVQIESLMLGSPAFYLRLTDSAHPGRLPEQRIVVLTELGKQVLETQWLLADPPRWRDGANSPELFTALQPPDVKPLRGCSLVWTKQGDRFSGEGDPQKCPAGAVFDPDAPLAALHVNLSTEGLVFSAPSPPAARGSAGAQGSAAAPAAAASGRVLRLKRRAE